MLSGLKKIWVSTHQKIIVCYIDVRGIYVYIIINFLMQPLFPKIKTHFFTSII